MGSTMDSHAAAGILEMIISVCVRGKLSIVIIATHMYPCLVRGWEARFNSNKICDGMRWVMEGG
jgi:hypothetical protein